MARSEGRAFFVEADGSEPAPWVRPPRLPRRRWVERLHAPAIVLIMLVLVGFVVLTGYVTWVGRKADVDQWKIKGPPCATVAQVSRIAAPPKRGPMNFVYAGAKFARSYGSASCATIPEDGLLTRKTYHVCQFNNPGAVTVSWGGRSTIFEPPVGRRVTVTLRGGRASCVVGGWFSA